MFFGALATRLITLDLSQIITPRNLQTLCTLTRLQRLAVRVQGEAELDIWETWEVTGDISQVGGTQACHLGPLWVKPQAVLPVHVDGQ